MYIYMYLSFLCSQAYTENPRNQWVCEWPGQVVICVSQVYWTVEVHEAIRQGPQGVKDYHQKLTKQLEGIVEMVRGKLPKQTRTTLGALVVMDVHARDVVLELVEKGKGGRYIHRERYKEKEKKKYRKYVKKRIILQLK